MSDDAEDQDSTTNRVAWFLTGAIIGALAVNAAKSWLTSFAPDLWLFVLGGLLLLGLGVALGEALHDSPGPGGTQTQVRTLTPLQLPPARVTVTVTRPGR